MRSTVIGDALVRLLEFARARGRAAQPSGGRGTRFGMLIRFELEYSDVHPAKQDEDELTQFDLR